MDLSKRARELKPSATFAISTLAQQFVRDGKDVINLSAGQPDFNTPDYIKKAGKEAIDKNITKYTPVAGMVEFKDAICSKFKKENNLDYSPKEVIAGTGGKQILFNALQALINPGDEVIIPVPYWVSYPPMVELAGGKPVYLETNFKDLFQISPEKLKSTITNKTKVLMLNSPSNPTGTVYSKDVLIEIGKICLDNSIIIISDEIYEHLTYDNKKAYSIASLGSAFKDITLTVNGLSKPFAMTGWRIGYGGGPEDLIAAMSRIQGHQTSNAVSISQYAGITALTSPLDSVIEMRKAFKERRDLAYSRLSAMEKIETFKPKGAFYIFPNVSEYYGLQYKNYKIIDSLTFCKYMIEDMLIAMVPGAPFGNDDCVRISYSIGTSDLDNAFERFEEGLKKLK